MATKPATNSAGGLLPGAITGQANPAEAQAILKKDYAAQWAFWHQDDTLDANGHVVEGELAKFLDQAITKGWLSATDSTNFETNLKKTAWYQKNGAQGLLAAQDEFASPTAWKDSLSRRVTDIQAIAAAQGYKLDPETINGLAKTSLYQAYDSTAWNSAAYQTQLSSKIAQTAKANGATVTGGAVLSNEQKLKAYAQGMGVNYGDSWFKDAADSINDPSSATDINTYEDMIRQQAKAKYSGFSDLIDKGVSVKQIADPYVQAKARLLEVPADSIDFTTDPHVQKGLGMGIAQGGITQPMPLWQYEQTLRQDPKWAYTDNARDYVSNTAHQILKDFGVMS